MVHHARGLQKRRKACFLQQVRRHDIKGTDFLQRQIQSVSVVLCSEGFDLPMLDVKCVIALYIPGEYRWV